MTNYVAIDIGGTNIKYGLIDQDGQLVESHEVANEAHKGGPHILQKTLETLPFLIAFLLYFLYNNCVPKNVQFPE